MVISAYILGCLWSKLKAFDTIGNKSNLRYKSEKHKEAVGQEKSMLPAASLWLIIIRVHMP